jgi:hypothetical protein
MPGFLRDERARPSAVRRGLALSLSLSLSLSLGRIGDFGLFAPILVLLSGMAVPPLALLGRVVLIPCAVVLLAMSVVLTEAGRIERREWPPVLLLAVCNLVGTPILTQAVALSFGLGDVGGWLVLVAACPAAGGAALVASLLRMPMRPLLLAQLLCFLALPLTAPLIASLVLEGAKVSPAALFLRVLLMVGGPALLGYGLRRLLGERRRLTLARPLRGLGVVALCGIALSIAGGLQRLDVAAAVWGDALLGLMLASLLGAMLGLLAAAASGRGLLGSFALGGAVRNVSLLWSATLGLTPPEGELVMMLGTLWTLLLPALLGLLTWQRYRLGSAMASGIRASAPVVRLGAVSQVGRTAD